MITNRKTLFGLLLISALVSVLLWTVSNADLPALFGTGAANQEGKALFPWFKTKTRTPTATLTATATGTPTASATATDTDTPTPTPTDSPTATTTETATPTNTPTATEAPAANPFGLMMNAGAFPSLPAELGSVYGRNLTAIFANTYTGNCPSCNHVTAAGEALFLTIRGNGGGGQASTPLTDTALISSVVRAAITNHDPALIVWGNEENSVTFYTGTAEDYRLELVAACDAAHSLGLLCANGGPTFGGLVYGLLGDLIDEGLTGPGGQACTLATEALAAADATRICSVTSISELSAGEQQLITKIRALIPVYQDVPDFANMHWYGESSIAFEMVYDWLRFQTGKTVIVNEWGLRVDDPAKLRALMEKMIEIEVPIAIYWNVAGAQAIPLSDAGGNLTAMGLEFQAVTSENWP